MIKKTFEKAKKEKGGDYADDTYFSRVQTYVNTKITQEVVALGDEKYYNPKFWKGSWFDDYIEDCIDRYHNDEVTATYIENTIHGVHAFARAIKEHRTFGKGTEKIRVGLKGSQKKKEGQLYRLLEEGVVDSKDHVTSMKPVGDELEKIMAQIPKSNRNYDSIEKALTAQPHTGGRIKAELRLRVGDIDYDKKTKHYINDKNKFNRRVQIKDDHMHFYRMCEDGLEIGTKLFPIYDKNGKEMNDRKASRYVQEVLKRATDKAGVNYEKVVEKKYKNGDKMETREVTVEMRFTSHSNRRGFAQLEYDKTKYLKRADIEALIAEYLNLQGSNKEKIIARISAERDRLNYYNIKNDKPKRDFSWEELRRLYVSLQLGHSRLDIVARYADLDEPIWKRKSK